MKWFDHDEVKTWSNSRESNPCSKGLDLRIHNDFGDIMSQSTSQVCGTNADDPTSMEFKDVLFWKQFSNLFRLCFE